MEIRHLRALNGQHARTLLARYAEIPPKRDARQAAAGAGTGLLAAAAWTLPTGAALAERLAEDDVLVVPPGRRSPDEVVLAAEFFAGQGQGC
jgi:hypothetical protein